MHLLDLDTNDSPNLDVVQALNNPVNNFFNKSKYYSKSGHAFSLKLYEIPKYH